jgi:hypothetical protein
MRKISITGVLFIGILTFVVIYTYAAERQLDLSQPDNIARLTGTWEGTWQLIGPSAGVHRRVIMVFSYDPKEEEYPFVRQTKTFGTSRSDPTKFAKSSGKLERGKLVFRGTEFDAKFRLFEGADGILILRGDGEGHSGTLVNVQVAYELHKSEVGKQETRETGKQ